VKFINKFIRLKVFPLNPKIKEPGGTMKSYYIRTYSGSTDYLSILDETAEGFMVRIYRDQDGYEKIIDEYMPASLFESCIRTGYLLEIEKKAASASA